MPTSKMPYAQQEEYRNRFVGRTLITGPSVTTAAEGQVLRSQLPANHRILLEGGRPPDDFDGWRMIVLVSASNEILRLDYY
ncbi:hypothetical protein TWF694_011189 [Orbilia ellipsospora]|uniref:Uncharacterized protein n=1 Tax=Orbilia ellipsospora TaxID=2528407 RepID=A0AAV9X9A5_9PEZI